MESIFSFFRNALDAFKEAYKYAEFDFYKLRGEVIALLDKARSKGYETPAYCEIKINVISSSETDVTIQTIYKRNEKFFRFKKDLDIGELVKIPYSVKNRLKSDREVTIKLSDFKTLYSINESEIIPSGDFRRLHIFTFKDAAGIPQRKEMYLKDELFYYVVKCTYVYSDGNRDTRTKYYGSIDNLPQDIIDRISKDENKECTIDVTNN